MKGIFYSIMALFLILPAVMLTLVYMDTVNIQNDVSTTQIKGRQLASYTDSISLDSQRVLRLTVKRAIYSVIQIMDDKCKFLENAKKALTALSLNGTYNNTNSSFMANSSIKDWRNTMQIKGEEIGYRSNITIHDLNISQYDSFNLQAVLNLSVDLESKSGDTRVDKNTIKKAYISLEGVTEPLFTIKTGCLAIERSINITHPPNGTDETDNVMKKGLFIPNPDAPSFFDRIEGSTSRNYTGVTGNIGMESIVDVGYLDSLGIDVSGYEQITHIDYEYFSFNPALGHAVNNSNYGYFRLDTEHANKYNITLQ